MKLRLPRRRIWRLGIYVVSFFLVIIAIDLVLVQVYRRITPGYDTTRITAPTLEGARVDYIAALDQHFGRGATAENNFAIPFFQILGPKAVAKDRSADILARLGISALPEKGDYLLTESEWYREKLVEEDTGPQEGANPTTMPLTVTGSRAQWVRDSDRLLTRLAEASTRPRLFIPLGGGERPRTMFAILLPYLNYMRGSANGLTTRAILRIESGDAVGGVRDLLAVHRIARLVAQGPTVIDRLVGVGIEHLACNAEQALAATGKLPPEAAQALRAELQALPDLPPMMEAVNMAERYCQLDYFQASARMGPISAVRLLGDITSNPNDTPPLFFALLPVAWADCMRTTNRMLDAAVAATSYQRWADRKAALDAWQQRILEISERHPLWLALSSDWPVRMLMPALARAQGRSDGARVERQMSIAALALAEYRAEKGAYPQSLEELCPKYLAAVPQDFFADAPLHYARQASGYLLYSVGEDMKDDGGKVKADLAVRAP